MSWKRYTTIPETFEAFYIPSPGMYDLGDGGGPRQIDAEDVYFVRGEECYQMRTGHLFRARFAEAPASEPEPPVPNRTGFPTRYERIVRDDGD